MAKISLKTITDDILLMVRNNNISESEDFSRAHIHAWIKQYAARLWKEELDKRKAMRKSGQLDDDTAEDNEFVSRVEVGPLMLEDVESQEDGVPTYTKRTVDTLDNVLDNNENNVLAIHDQLGENIQYMNHVRRHYAYWRKYTFGEMTGYYDNNGHVYIQGLVDQNALKYIYVLYLRENDLDIPDGEGDGAPDEDDVEIPGWMVPPIKELIMKNELAFMLNRPSDDSNNATLASVKPHGPQDDEE